MTDDQFEDFWESMAAAEVSPVERLQRSRGASSRAERGGGPPRPTQQAHSPTLRHLPRMRRQRLRKLQELPRQAEVR